MVRISERMAGMNPSAIREMLKTAGPDTIAFSAGNPSPELFPAKELAELASETFLNESAAALQYGITEGWEPLRRAVKKRMKEKYSIGGEGDDLIIVSGGQQGIDLCAKCLVNEGEVVIAESPSFIGALNDFRSQNTRLVGVPMDGDGMIVDELEKVLAAEPTARLIYTIPTYQNPAGVTLSLERRKKMLELADKYDVMIIEDSPYFELRYDGEQVPTLKSMDKSGRVLFAGSFSKIIAPGIRLGFACGPKELVSKMTVAKQGQDVHTNLFFQILAEKYMTRYDLDAHIADCCRLYKAKRDRMIDGIEKYFDKRVTYNKPAGGLFLWCELPEGCSGTEFCALAAENGVSAVPGAAFDLNEDKNNRGFRLNFSLPSFEQIDEGILRLKKSIDEYLAAKLG